MARPPFKEAESSVCCVGMLEERGGKRGTAWPWRRKRAMPPSGCMRSFTWVIRGSGAASGCWGGDCDWGCGGWGRGGRIQACRLLASHLRLPRSSVQPG